MRITCDFLVLGSGVAGLTFALEAAKHGEVVVVTKRGLSDSNTNWAQGGIAAVLDPNDSFEAHAKDTLSVGYGLSKPEVVDLVVKGGPAGIKKLIELGAHFDEKDDKEPGAVGDGNALDMSAIDFTRFDLTREGGHTARRVIHAGDVTGREVQRVLAEAARKHPNIRVLEHHMAIDLLELSKYGGPHQVAGAYVLDTTPESPDAGKVHAISARATVLATGGAGKVYLYTTNPDVATGDGVAMAYRAGALIANMEFFQFHPTSLFHPLAKSFLISEALRGEGGILRLANGDAFMARHHPMKDLAPRDVVARTIDYEMKRTGADCVFLDMTHHPASYLKERFPTIYAECLRFGVDLTAQPIPVVPAAHYMCGGVVCDGDGRTSVPGLWAIGEVSASGLHGANRLASNSLLEGLVYGQRAADALANLRKESPHAEVPEWDAGEAVPSDEGVVISQNWDELRRFMWNYVGIVRTDKRLRRAARRVALLKDEIREYYWEHHVTRDLLELRNIADVAEMIIGCASVRKESRGLHYNADHPDTDERFGKDTVMVFGEPPHLRHE
ncbi:MAG: L-aspartate oxidase [Sandaracinaceae bacterium]|nr:L-aspartate oxidase [Sandaracinaceae bacterium]